MAILLGDECAVYPSPGGRRKPDGGFCDIVAPMDTPSPAGAGKEYGERARRLAPQIEACADQIEQERRLAEPVLEALFAAGMFRLLLPRSLDGGGGAPVPFPALLLESA